MQSVIQTAVKLHALFWETEPSKLREENARQILDTVGDEVLSRVRCTYRALFGRDLDHDLHRSLQQGSFEQN